MKKNFVFAILFALLPLNFAFAAETAAGGVAEPDGNTFAASVSMEKCEGGCHKDENDNKAAFEKPDAASLQDINWIMGTDKAEPKGKGTGKREGQDI